MRPRNRLEACKRAGVEPTTIEMNGSDPLAHILSANINRRHMTKGQRAMAVARIYPEPGERGRGKKDLKIKDFNSGAVSQARTVLKHLPEIAELVLAGVKPLNEAYEEAPTIFHGVVVYLKVSFRFIEPGRNRV